ncbi:MAG: SH3 domain-containing protein [Sphingomonadaceae bacterium]
MKRIAGGFSLLAAALLVAGAAGVGAQESRDPPYWASISAGKARMRTGPGTSYPTIWLYRRADLPIRVVETYPNWRKVEDPDGETGWMFVNLLSAERTAIVTGDEGELRPMHDKPDAGAPIRYRAEPGVVGKLEKCRDGWCLFDVEGRAGWIRTLYLWGVDRGEEID